MRARFLFLFLFGLLAPAAIASPGLGIRSQSLGEAYRAVATDGEAALYNPGGLVRLRRFGVQGAYGASPAGPVHDAGVLLMDSGTNPFLAAALGYFFDVEPVPPRQNPFAHLVVLSLASPIVTRNVGFGLNVTYRNLPPFGEGEGELGDADGGSPDDERQEPLHKISLDTGILTQLGQRVSLAAAAYNLVPTRSARAPMSVGAGISATLLGTWDEASRQGVLDGLTLASDWLMEGLLEEEITAHHFSLGVEYLLLSMVPLRAGYHATFAPQDKHRLALGSGFAWRGFGLDVVWAFLPYDIGDSLIGFALQYGSAQA